MKNSNAFVCGAFLLLAGCAARSPQPAPPPEPAPEPFFTAPIVDVRDGPRADKYWVLKNKRGSFRPSFWPSDEEGCWLAQIDYIIDSNGNIFNAEVVEVRPDDRFQVDALRMLAMHEYVPAETNPDRVPVHSTITMEMEIEGHRCEWE